MKRFTIEELIEHCERQKKRMGAMCVNSANILLLEHVDTAEYLNELKEYKDAEEQGLLFRLPCKIGDVLYYTTKCGIKELIVREMRIRKYYTDVFTEDIKDKKYAFTSREIGKTVFLTREEAEAALTKMEG